MSTHATIVRKNNDGTYDCIFNYWDGYVSYLGCVLKTTFNTEESVEWLFNQKYNISSIKKIDEDLFNKFKKEVNGKSKEEIFKICIKNYDYTEFRELLNNSVKIPEKFGDNYNYIRNLKDEIDKGIPYNQVEHESYSYFFDKEWCLILNINEEPNERNLLPLSMYNEVELLIVDEDSEGNDEAIETFKTKLTKNKKLLNFFNNLSEESLENLLDSFESYHFDNEKIKELIEETKNEIQRDKINSKINDEFKKALNKQKRKI